MPLVLFRSWKTACAGGLLAAAALLSGCAAPGRAAPGTTVDAALAQYGAPTARYPLPDGQRLQYSEMPAGSNVWNLDFDTAGRLRSVDQGLRYANFNQIVLGQWTAADVERMLGRPMRVERVMSFQGPVWTYRFNDLNNFRLVHIHIDPAGIVRKIQYTDELLFREPLGL